MRLPLDPRAPGRKRALESEARALKLPVPPGFHAWTPYVGAACRKLIVEVETALHLAIDGEFGPPLLRVLFPPPSTAKLRGLVVGVGEWGIRHHAQFVYTQDARRTHGLSLAPLSQGLATDCSMWTDIAYKWAGVPASHCPMGNAYKAWGNTETLLNACRGLPSVSHLKLADIVVWGVRGATHHAAFVIDDAGTANPLLCSHGHQGGPEAVRFVDENYAQEGRPATPVTILG